MDFSFTAEQDMLRSSARAFLGERLAGDRVAALADADPGWDPGSWPEIAGLGWTGLAVDTRFGGAGMGPLEEGIVLEEAGRALYPGPLWSCLATALPALVAGAQGGTPEPLAAVLAGTGSATLAHAEAGGPVRLGTPEPPRTRARAGADGWRVSGSKRFVSDAGIASGFAVTATVDRDSLTRAGGPPGGGVPAGEVPGRSALGAARFDREGVAGASAGGEGSAGASSAGAPGWGELGTPDAAVFWVAAEDARVTVRSTADRTRRLGDVEFADSPARLLAAPGWGQARAATVLATTRARLLALSACEAVGVAQRALEICAEHARSREQFGRPIGSFQAVAHRVADVYAAVELARSVAYWAVWTLTTEAAGARGPGPANPAVPGAAAAAVSAARAACESAIQILGGTGMTWDHPLHRFYKRALALAALEGGPRASLAAVADAILPAVR